MSKRNHITHFIYRFPDKRLDMNSVYVCNEVQYTGIGTYNGVCMRLRVYILMRCKCITNRYILFGCSYLCRFCCSFLRNIFRTNYQAHAKNTKTNRRTFNNVIDNGNITKVMPSRLYLLLIDI